LTDVGAASAASITQGAAPLFTPVHPPEINAQDFNDASWTGVAETIEPYATRPLKLDRDQGFRHSGWANDRQRVYDALVRTEQSPARKIDFAECGKHAYVLRSVEEPDLYILGGSACHDRFCLPCAKDRARVIATNVQDRIGDKQARFLTLTLRSTTESLADLLSKLTRDFTSLRRTKLWRNAVTGGVAFLEVKWFEPTQRWHPHLHCLLQGRYLPKDDLSNLWKKITGTSWIIDIRIAADNHHVTNYIAKYATKALDHSVVLYTERIDEAVTAMKGKRLCMTFGSWRGAKLTEQPETGTWIQLGTLYEVVKHAEEGWQSAMDALDALEITFNRPTRGPPELEKARRRRDPDLQMRLDLPAEAATFANHPMAV